MKVCIIQPKYTTDDSESDKFFQQYLDFLDKCDESMDIIVLPESSDIPALAKTKELQEKSVEKFTQKLIDRASQTAKRCNAIVFFNARYKTDKGLRNTTYAMNRNGEIFTVTGSGLKARAFCHEIDHLDGVLFIDNARDVYSDVE